MLFRDAFRKRNTEDSDIGHTPLDPLSIETMQCHYLRCFFWKREKIQLFFVAQL